MFQTITSTVINGRPSLVTDTFYNEGDAIINELWRRRVATYIDSSVWDDLRGWLNEPTLGVCYTITDVDNNPVATIVRLR